MAVIFFDRFYTSTTASDPIIFAETIVAAGVGIASGFLLFPGEASLIAIFLIAFAQARTVEALLQRNRDDIWNHTRSPWKANLDLARSLLVLFLGILLTYVVAVLIIPQDNIIELFSNQIGKFGVTAITEVEFGTPSQILAHNVLVFIACFLFALLYRHGGMLLVLAWNASVWGVVFAYIARTHGHVTNSSWVLYLLKTIPCIMPHLVMEAVAYIIIAMSGVFLSKAIQKYSLDSSEFAQVSRAVIQLSIVALVALTLASLLEGYLAPRLIQILF